MVSKAEMKWGRKLIAGFLAMVVIFTTILANNVTGMAATKGSITLSSKKETIAVGKSVQLKVKSVKGLKSKSVTWKSSNSKVAKVSSKGKVTGVKPGSAKITATSKSNKKIKAVCKITVKKDAVQSIQLDKTACIIVKGKNAKVKVDKVIPSTASSNVTWKINKSSIAKVAVKGNTAIITGKKAGKAILTATAADGSKKTAKVDIVVVNKKSDIKRITNIQVSLEKEEMYVGDTAKAKAVVSPSKAAIKKVYWCSENEEIATIDQTGKITALKAGTVKIAALAQDGSGKKGTVTLIVKEKAQPTTTPTKQPEVTQVPTAEPTIQPTVTEVPTPTAEPTALPTRIPDSAFRFENANKLVIATERMNCDFYILNKEEQEQDLDEFYSSYNGEEYCLSYPYPLNEEFILQIVRYDEEGKEILKENHTLSYDKVPVIYTSIGGIDGNCIRVDIRLKSKEEDISNVIMSLTDKDGQAVEFELQDDQVQSSEAGSWWEHGYYLNLSNSLIKDEPYTLTVSAPDTGLGDYTEELMYASKGYITGTFLVRDINTGEYVEAEETFTAHFYQGNKHLFAEKGMRCQTQEGETYYEFVNIPIGEYTVKIETFSDSSAVIENVVVEKDKTTSLGEVKTKYDWVSLESIDETNVYLDAGSKIVYVKNSITKNQLLESIKVLYFGEAKVMKDGQDYAKEQADFELTSQMRLKLIPEQEKSEPDYWDIKCLGEAEYEYARLSNSVWNVSLESGTENGTIKLCHVQKGMRYVVSDSQEPTGEETIIDIVSNEDIDNIKVNKAGSITIFVGELTKDNQYKKCYYGDDLKGYIKKQAAPEEGIDYIIDYINGTIAPAFNPGENRQLEYSLCYDSMKKFEIQDGNYVPVSLQEILKYKEEGGDKFSIRFAEDEENVSSEADEKNNLNTMTAAEQELADTIYCFNTSEGSYLGIIDYEMEKTKVEIPDTVYYTTSTKGFSETSEWIQGSNEVIDVEPGTTMYFKRLGSQEEKIFEYRYELQVPERPTLSEVTVQMTSCYRKTDGNWYFNVSLKNLETTFRHMYCFTNEVISDEKAFDEMKIYYIDAGAEKTATSLLNDNEDSRPKYCYLKRCAGPTNFASEWTKLVEVSGDNEFDIDDIP